MMRGLILGATLALAGCSGGLQKSLPGGAAMTDYRSAFHIAGETRASRTVVHIVGLDNGEFGLMTYVGRSDGRYPGITRAGIGGKQVDYQRLSSIPGDGMMTESGLIVMNADAIATAAGAGVELTLCGVGTCYDASIPAGLFVQVLVE